MRLQGKSALITGAASGIGRGIAELFAANGALVTIADIDAGAAESVAEGIRSSGGTADAIQLDVTSGDSNEEAVAAAVSRFGSLDILIANAGISARGMAHEISEDHWDRALAINLTGAWKSMRAALPVMMAQGSGSIVSTASITGIAGTPDTAAYSATKAGLIGLTRQIATDYARYGIRANSVCPGSIVTPLWVQAYSQAGTIDADHLDEGKARVARRYPLGRVGTVDDVAQLVLFLASDEAGWMTGLAVPVDGGVGTTAWQAEHE